MFHVDSQCKITEGLHIFTWYIAITDLYYFYRTTSVSLRGHKKFKKYKTEI